MKKIAFALALSVLVTSVAIARPHDDGDKDPTYSPGEGGNGPWASENIDLLSHLPLDQIGSGGASGVFGNDVWGWTHQATGREFAIFGMTNGTSFIEVTNPTNPVYLGKLDSHTGNNSTWRDMKVFNNRAYIVADNNGFHGMQVFDLDQLLTVTTPQSFTNSDHMSGFSRAHNISINTDSGYAYISGHRNYNNEGSGLSSGLIMVDLNGPGTPTIVGDFGADGYTHDVQVVNYIGPDSDYAGKEIAFASNEDTFTIVDVTNKATPVQVSSNGYTGVEYAHQGWVSEDQRFYFHDDELDEYWHIRGPDGQLGTADDLPPIPTSTHIWNIEDLDNPMYIGFYEGQSTSIDHNLYVKDGLIYQANYTSGLRVLEMTDVQNGVLTEIGFFDTFAPNDGVTFDGAWSVYPFFDSGTLLVSDINGGLFVLKLNQIPEPSSIALIGLLAVGFAMRRRRRVPR